jgi:hypothetical protein
MACDRALNIARSIAARCPFQRELMVPPAGEVVERGEPVASWRRHAADSSAVAAAPSHNQHGAWRYGVVFNRVVGTAIALLGGVVLINPE